MQLVALVALMEVKHFVCDFILQTDYHVGKFNDEGWILPLASHCAIHAFATLAICLLLCPHMWWLALVDFVIHFIMDRIKASRKLLGRWKALSGEEYWRCKMDLERLNLSEYYKDKSRKRLSDNKRFWWSLGFDQCVHQLTSLYIAYSLSSIN